MALLEGLGIALLFAYALSWLGVCVGLLARSAESAQAFGFMVLFPLTFISNALVPTVAMPELLRTFADWNPVSAVTAAVRLLWGDPNPSLGSLSWSMQNPVIMALGLVDQRSSPSACQSRRSCSDAAPPTDERAGRAPGGSTRPVPSAHPPDQPVYC